jgi:hypothetical protein
MDAIIYRLYSSLYKGLDSVRAEGDLCCESSKCVQCGEPTLGSVVYKLFFKALYRFCTKTHFA